MIFEMIIEMTPVSQEPLLDDQNVLDNVKKKKKGMDKLNIALCRT